MTARRVAVVSTGLSVPSSTRLLADRLAAATTSALQEQGLDVRVDVVELRPVLLGATAGTARHSLALEHAMRPLFSYLRAVIVPTAVFAAPEDWGGADAAGRNLGDRITRARRPVRGAARPALGGRAHVARPVPRQRRVRALRPAAAGRRIERGTPPPRTMRRCSTCDSTSQPN